MALSIRAAVIDAKEDGSTMRFSSTMTHPARRAYAGYRYEGPHRFGGVIAGLAAAVVVIMAIVGVLASCRG